jgi:hypothetical protein
METFLRELKCFGTFAFFASRALQNYATRKSPFVQSWQTTIKLYHVLKIIKMYHSHTSSKNGGCVTWTDFTEFVWVHFSKMELSLNLKETMMVPGNSYFLSHENRKNHYQYWYFFNRRGDFSRTYLLISKSMLVTEKKSYNYICSPKFRISKVKVDKINTNFTIPKTSQYNYTLAHQNSKTPLTFQAWSAQSINL